MEQPADSGKYTWGIILIIIGLLFLLENLGFLDFSDVISRYWPVLLILLGLKIILNRRSSTT